jgi:hypothetical protein
LKQLLLSSLETKEMITKRIFKSREKDYKNRFRQMVYDSVEEMSKVVGKLEDNASIKQERQALQQYKKQVKSVLNDFGLSE